MRELRYLVAAAAADQRRAHFRHPELESALRHVLGREPAVVAPVRIPADAG